MNVFTYLLFFVICLSKNSSQELKINSNWKQPNAWSKSNYLSSQNVDGDSDVADEQLTINTNENESINRNNNDAILIYYLKLVKFLFNPSKMYSDATTNGNYHLNLHIEITPAEFDKLKKLTNPIDIDQIVSGIMLRSKSGTIELAKELYFSIKEYLWYYENILMSSTRLKLITECLLFFTLIGLIRKYFKFHWITSVICLSVFFLYEYLITECNRQKDIKNLLDIQKYGDNNPCKKPSKGQSFWGYLFTSNNEYECKEYMSTHYNVDMECSKVEIFNEFIKLIFYNQMRNFIDNVVDMILSINKTHGIIITLFVIVLLHSYIQIFIKSIFKYVIATIITDTKRNQSESMYQSVQHGITHNQLSDDTINSIVKLASDQTRVSELLAHNCMQLNKQTSGIEIIHKGSNEKLDEQQQPQQTKLIDKNEIINENEKIEQTSLNGEYEIINLEESKCTNKDQ